MAKHYVTCSRDYDHVTPATTLEGVEPRTGNTYTICDVPSKVYHYIEGQQLSFGTAKAAKAFVKAHNGVFFLGCYAPDENSC